MEHSPSSVTTTRSTHPPYPPPTPGRFSGAKCPGRPSTPPWEPPRAPARGAVEIPPSALLKLDLQGFELEALRGAPATLGRVRYVLIEIGLRSNYVGEPPFEALYDLLRGAGFRFLRPVDLLRGPSR